MAEKDDSIHRRSKSNPVRRFDERPDSLDLETDLTKLVVLDFLSSQPIERLTARNAGRKARSLDSRESHQKSSLGKSCSDVSKDKSYRSRYEKLAKSGKSLRKQYSLRLQRDLDEYLKTRGKSMDDLSESFRGGSGEGFLTEYQHQRSYTEGEAFYRRSGSPLWDECEDTTPKLSKPRRKISQELNKGITEFNTQTLRHVEPPAPVNLAHSTNTDDLLGIHHRPQNLKLPPKIERRLSPVLLSPESQVAAKLESISQEILTKYPDLFNEQISRASLDDLTYEKFASVARKVIEKHPGGWTRIALVCYFARELALEDESSDEQLDNLVSFSSRFISETSAEWIASQGGWGALEGDSENLSPSKVRQKLKEQPDIVDGLVSGQYTSQWLNYLKFGIAALAVGVTVAYNVAR